MTDTRAHTYSDQTVEAGAKWATSFDRSTAWVEAEFSPKGGVPKNGPPRANPFQAPGINEWMNNGFTKTKAARGQQVLYL